MKKIVINGNDFYDIDGFYAEIDRLLTKDLTWKTGHNLDAFNDLLCGGFGIHEDGEPTVIIWENAEKSKKELGYSATVRHYENMLIRGHSTNINKVSALLENAKREKDDTLFDIIIQIIESHDNIELLLK